MDIQTLTNYFLEYGAFFIFVIVLLEYLNLPGFPAGVIMPLGFPGTDQLPHGHGPVCGGRTDRKLGSLPSGPDRRQQAFGLVF